MKRQIVAAAAAALAVGMLGTPAPAQATPPDIDNTSIESVRNAYLTQLWPTLWEPLDWTGDTSKCLPSDPAPQSQPDAAAGTISAKARTAAFEAANFYRELAGLAPVTENATGSHLAQQAALIMRANDMLTHTPTGLMACYSLDGREGATSNLALFGKTQYGGRAVVEFIDDSGDNNVPVGHRRQLLFPLLSEAGFGATQNTAAFRAHSRGTGMMSPRPVGATAWPPAGYVPWEVMPTSTRWSYSDPGTDFSDAAVSMTKNGAAIATRITIRNDSTPGSNVDPVLVWEIPGGLTSPAVDTPDVYQVILTGIPGAPISYQVKVFRAGVAKAESVDVEGIPAPNNTLAATAKGLTPTKPANDTFVSYAWYRNGMKVGDERTYTPTYEDVGNTLIARATVSTLYNDWASGSTDSAPVTIQPGTLTPGNSWIHGQPRVGELLIFSPDNWGDEGRCEFDLQWLRNGAPINGATSESYRLATADTGTTISLQASCSVPGFLPATITISASGPVTSPSTASPDPEPTMKLTTTPTPKISGTAKVGKTLTAKPGTWKPSGVSFEYQWYRNGARIAGATASSYPLQGADKGKKITVGVTGSKDGYRPVGKTSKATKKVASGTLAGVKPKITGTPLTGSVLTAVPGTWKPAEAALSYQWYRNGKKIRSATASSYTLTIADKGKKITVKVTGKASGYTTATKTSSKTKKVK